MIRRRVRRWRVGLPATLALTGAGLLFASPTLLTAAAIPLAYVLYGMVSRMPAEPELAVERSFDRTDPAPGETVGVTLTVANGTGRALPDVRVVDGVPDELAVVDGSPRIGTALAPDETAVAEYAVVARRGEYEFADPALVLRSVAATERLTATVEADGETSLACASAVGEVPLREAAIPRTGEFPTDAGGSGLEFYATREYRPGDPLTRLDWRHYAKTGEFVTVQYRDERALRTVIVVDARPVGRVATAAGYPTGAELSAYAGERVRDALDRAGAVTSVTAVGLDGEGSDGVVGSDGLAWAGAEGGGNAAGAEAVFRAVRAAADGKAANAPGAATAATATDGGPDGTVRRLLARLPPNAQVVVCTPLLDDWPVSLASGLSARGYPAVVVSPDVAAGERPGQAVAGVRRRLRLREIERAGTTTVDWESDRPIDGALRRALAHLQER